MMVVVEVEMEEWKRKITKESRGARVIIKEEKTEAGGPFAFTCTRG